MTPPSRFRQVASVAVDRESALVYEMGWQSWSPTSVYPVTATSARPVNEFYQLYYRPETPAPAQGFQGEGLLAVQESAGGAVHVVAAIEGRETVPSIRAELRGSELIISADAPVRTAVYHDVSLHEALARDADLCIERTTARIPSSIPPIWASWYQYFTEFTQADLNLNLQKMDELELPVGIVRLDDAFQAGIGDWLDASDGFGSLQGMIGSVLERGRRAGIWTAPFLAGKKSRLYAEHPEWLVRDANGAPVVAHHNWGQYCYALDTTHPGVQDYLGRVFETYRAWGVDYFMIDFVYAGAMQGTRFADVDAIAAYRTGLATVRNAIGEDSLLQGCGAPMYPSAGYVDTMRVGADIGPAYSAERDELGSPGGEAAIVSTIGRAFMQGRFWINDPDCFIVRPEVERREEWAQVVRDYGGVRISSDGLDQLDDWGLEMTRELLVPASTAPLATSLPLTTPAVGQSLKGRDHVGRPAGATIYDEIAAAP